MSTLTLLLKKNNLGARIDHGVVARIQGYPEGSASDEDPFFLEVVIPASREKGINVEVAPGRYRVQAILPSGEILQEERMVESGQTVPIDFAVHSSREWLSWQKFEGISPDPDQVMRSISDIVAREIPPGGPPGGSRFARLWRRFRSVGVSRGARIDAPSEVSPPFPDVLLALGPEPRLSFVWQPPESSSRTWSQSATAIDARYFIQNWPEEKGIKARRAKREGSLSLWEVEGLDYETDHRWWAVVDAEDMTEIASIPRPWQDDAMEQPARLDILVDSADRALSARTTLTVHDTTLGGLLAYLGRGHLGAARPLLDSLNHEGLIERTIQGKRRNPLGACAAAYVGLAVFPPEERERWDNWLPNMMNWFPWLPDGAIVHARRIIQRPRNSMERQEALAALKESYARGIPYFTAGVMHLRDSLLLYAKKDSEARQMLETVSRLATRIDPGQAFTVLRFPKG